MKDGMPPDAAAKDPSLMEEAKAIGKRL